MYEDLVPVKRHQGRRESNKFVLPCQRYADSGDKQWLSGVKMLNETQPVLRGVLKNNKAVVIKHGSVEDSKADYDISKTLADEGVPNMIKYYCHFTCKDTVQYVNNNRQVFEANRDFLCNGSPGDRTDTERGFIVMPFYEKGDIVNLGLRGRGSFDAFKNLLKQIVCACLYAFMQCGFVHDDLHQGNVLFRNTTKSSVQYGEYTLAIGNIYAVVMDFGECTMRSTNVSAVYDQLWKYLTIIGTEADYKMMGLETVLSSLTRLSGGDVPATCKVMGSLVKDIDRMSFMFSRRWRCAGKHDH